MFSKNHFKDHFGCVWRTGCRRWKTEERTVRMSYPEERCCTRVMVLEVLFEGGAPRTCLWSGCGGRLGATRMTFTLG